MHSMLPVTYRIIIRPHRAFLSDHIFIAMTSYNVAVGTFQAVFVNWWVMLLLSGAGVRSKESVHGRAEQLYSLVVSQSRCTSDREIVAGVRFLFYFIFLAERSGRDWVGFRKAEILLMLRLESWLALSPVLIPFPIQHLLNILRRLSLTNVLDVCMYICENVHIQKNNKIKDCCWRGRQKQL